MKKLLLVALMAAFTTTSFAQLLTGTSVARSEEKSSNWSYLYFQYSPGLFSPKEGDSETYNAVSFGWNQNIHLSNRIPLFLEFGIGVQYSFYNKKEDYSDLYSYYGYHMSYKSETKLNMVSMKIPLGVSYVFDIPNTPISIIPNLGFDFRINTWAEQKYNGHTVNPFDKDDMGSSDATWNRFQVGGHAGVNARFWKKLLVGFSYQLDFSEIAKDLRMNQANITVGYCF